MTNEIQQNRYDQIIRRVTGSIGPGSRVAESLSELFPVIDVERVPGELLRLGKIDICSGAASATGAAGEVAIVQLFNPVDSGKLITISQVIVSVNSSALLRYQFTTTARTNNIPTPRFRDLRHDVTLIPVGQVRTASSASQIGQIGEFRLLANTAFTLKDENSVAVLIGGTGMDISNTELAAPMNCTFLWRERLAEESEVNF